MCIVIEIPELTLVDFDNVLDIFTVAIVKLTIT